MVYSCVFETPPGKQAQADWAYCGRFPDPSGHIFPVYVFVMVLSFSRMLFTPEIGLMARERMSLESQLRGAIERGEIEVHYQPEYDVPTAGW
jgi:hypothetical protein